MRRRLPVLAALLAAVTSACALVAPSLEQRLANATSEVRPPVADGSVRFLVIGDSGTGGSAQYETAEEIVRARKVFPFDFAIMLGDNMYGAERPHDYVRKFEQPYKPLLDGGVTFYASLGNHDDPTQRFYEPFNMGEQRYYTFRKEGRDTPGVRFFALDSTYMGPEQLTWLTSELEKSGSPWKIAFFHHPLYSSGGRHGSEFDLREVLEPLFVEHGVSVVFAGHEHFYERIKPQQGITYFTSGAAAKLRYGDVRETGMTAVAFDTDHSFMLIEIAGETMHFQSISRLGRLVDHGTIVRRQAPAGTP